MKILLVVATQQEIMEDRFEGCTVLITGVGMVNTSIQLTKELLQDNYDLVINMGVVGSFNTLKIGEVVEVIQDSFSEIGFENNSVFEEFSDLKIKASYSVEGKTDLQKVKGISVNTVHGNEESIAKVVKRINPDVESMEGAAVFKVCKEFKTPCMQIRSISNKVESRNKANWDIPLAIQNLNNEVAKIIAEL